MQEISFQNCSCIAGQLELRDVTSLDNSSAVEGQCDQGCNKLGLYLGVIFFALLLIFILQVPNIIITVRYIIILICSSVPVATHVDK